MEIRKSFACAVCVSLILLAAIAVPSSAAAQAPDNPTIAFTANAEGGNIWLMDPDGKNQRPILAIKGNPVPLGLVWSPDGNKLAFHTEIRKNIDVYLVNANGENLRQLTNHEAEDSWPNWHPGGQKIAFATNRDGNFEIYEMTSRGEVLQNITNDAVYDSYPAWSRDGRNIAFSSIRGKTLGDIWVMDASGENLKNLTNHRAEDFRPRWSPDSQKIAWLSRRTGRGHVYVMDADGENFLQIVKPPSSEKRDPEWSPDGKKIACVHFAGNIASIRIFEAEVKEQDAEFVEILPAIGFPNRAPAWFDPDFVKPFSVSPVERRILAWGWLKQAGDMFSGR